MKHVPISTLLAAYAVASGLMIVALGAPKSALGAPPAVAANGVETTAPTGPTVQVGATLEASRQTNEPASSTEATCVVPEQSNGSASGGLTPRPLGPMSNAPLGLSPIDQNQARDLMQIQGYSDIRDVKRDGDRYSAVATRNGQSVKLAINALDGTLQD